MALLAFLFAVTFPALAAFHRALDPLAFVVICGSDAGAAQDSAGPAVPGSLKGKLKSAHCLMCLGTATLPPAPTLVSMVVAAVPELVLPVDQGQLPTRDPAALQPLNPRAPPRG